MSEQEQTLRLVMILGREPQTMAGLCRHFNVQRQTVGRWMRHARHLGVRIVKDTDADGVPVYVVLNYDAVAPTVEHWLDLEREQARICATMKRMSMDS